MENKRKYNQVNLKDRCKALKELNNGKSVRQISAMYNVSIGTVSNWLKNKEKLIQREKNNESVNSSRNSRISGNSAILDERIYNWFSAARSRNIPVSGPILQEKAKMVSGILNIPDFKASNGWLESFRKRHNISFRILSGESAGIDHQVVQNWKDNINNILEGYQMSDIWNIDETGLFWRGLPNKSLVTKGEEAKGGKLAKDRLTICLLVSATGEKFKPLVIGKSMMPRVFNKVLPEGVYWKSNKKAWMTAALFHQYLLNFNSLMKQQKRNVFLLLDNAPCHPQVELSNVKIAYMPPNTTAACQPLDAGIIKNFKVHYRKRLVQRLLHEDVPDRMVDVIKQINLNHAVKWIETSWLDVHTETIIQCFHHCGIQAHFPNSYLFIDDEQELKLLVTVIGNDQKLIIEENLDVFDTHDKQWEENLLNPIEDEKESDESDDTDHLSVIPSISEAIRALDVLSNYAFYRDLGNAKKHLQELEKCLMKDRMKSLRSTTLEEYFHKTMPSNK